MPLKFEWNPNKAKKNIEKHGVSFDEAATVFFDPLSMTYDDPDHSYDKNRYIIIGLSDLGRLLFVSHAETDNIIKIISARQLTRKERKQYEQ
jgi:hypothetical protein